jgi:hypothetical protein
MVEMARADPPGDCELTTDLSDDAEKGDGYRRDTTGVGVETATALCSAKNGMIEGIPGYDLWG